MSNSLVFLLVAVSMTLCITGASSKCCHYDNLNCHDNQFCVIRNQDNEHECADEVCEPDDVWKSIFHHHHHHHHHHHCSKWTKIKCAAKIALCAAKCVNTGAISCVTCLGSSYGTCKQCF